MFVDLNKVIETLTLEEMKELSLLNKMTNYLVFAKEAGYEILTLENEHEKLGKTIFVKLRTLWG